MHGATSLNDLSVDHVRFYVEDSARTAEQLRRGYGFAPYAVTEPSRAERECSIAVGAQGIRLVMTQSLTDEHPASAFTAVHGDGVADIALRTADARAAFTAAVARGARPVQLVEENDGVVTASIAGFGDVVHTFVQRDDTAAPHLLPDLEPIGPETGTADVGLRSVDHFAVCTEAGTLEPTVRFYCDVLDFAMVFSEDIVVGRQAMRSKVVQSGSGGVTLTLIEPDRGRDPGQIDEFIKNHSGPGVQHIALATDDIVDTVGLMRERGVSFLATPGSYYRMLTERIRPRRHEVGQLQKLDLLIDEDHDGQLLQIFARSTHRSNTFFFEIIERLGATTFGSGNIRALYEAVERERA